MGTRGVRRAWCAGGDGRMSTTQPPGTPESAARTEARFRHELYPYRGQDQFMTGTLGYIREALEADEAVV
ncbi:sensor histidine kinase, partial [Streptomyces sp. SID7760]|nr:sensor histidine kinase [Streptomyces sp. SID7760]